MTWQFDVWNGKVMEFFFFTEAARKKNYLFLHSKNIISSYFLSHWESFKKSHYFSPLLVFAHKQLECFPGPTGPRVKADSDGRGIQRTYKMWVFISVHSVSMSQLRVFLTLSLAKRSSWSWRSFLVSSWLLPISKILGCDSASWSCTHLPH